MAKDFEDYLRKENTIIKNSKVFDIGYLPDDISKRKDTSTLFKETSVFINYGTPNHILLTGLPGLGKTVTVRYICRKKVLKEKGVDPIYINCRDKTTTQILNELIELSGNGTPVKNLSDTEMANMFLRTLVKPVLLVLDEIDRGRKVENLLYRLSRTSEIDSVPHPPISMILVSNNLSWDEAIDASIRSSLQLSRVFFRPYAVNELRDILKERAKLGFFNENVISITELEEIAKKTVEEKRSDCRVALKTLFYVAQKAEEQSKNRVERKHITNSFYIATTDIDRERITRLHNSQLLILYACCENEGESFTKIFEVYGNYTVELNIQNLSQTMVYYWIGYLSNQGFIKIFTKREKQHNGAPKKTLVINPLVKTRLVMEELSKRMLKLTND